VELAGKIAFVGAGNIGEALIKGLIVSKAVKPEQLVASEPRADQRQRIAERYRVRMLDDNVETVRDAEIVVLAVKPQILHKVLDQIRPALRTDALVVSIAAGKDIAGIQARLGPDVRVVRAMPNVACLVAEGATGLAAGPNVTAAELALAQRIFDLVGMSVVIEDAVTGLSGSGPAYIFMVVEALSDAGVKVGLSRWDAQALAAQTVLGAAKLVIETQEHPGRLKDMVCSPGGTAIAAVHTLEQGGLRTTLINAVEVATRRSKELGQESK
jgi:pyrroline-5-carboxylate reductase